MLGVLVLVEVLLLGRGHVADRRASVSAPATGGADNVAALGKSLFTTYLFPFEATSALLVIAVVGAVVLARRHARPSRQGADRVGPRSAEARRRTRACAGDAASVATSTTRGSKAASR